jgi:hypothetical protein
LIRRCAGTVAALRRAAMKAAPFSILAACLSTILCAGCTSDAVANADGANLTSGGACPIVSVRDGHTLTTEELGALKDPVATLILQGGDCPLTFSAIQAKLKKAAACNGPGPVTNFVSNRDQLLGRPDTYRAVGSRQCQGGDGTELFLSVSGINTKTDANGSVTDVQVPQATVELIGKGAPPDTTPEGNGVVAGVFDFYALDNGRWNFFGSSFDLIAQGYDCNTDGACIPKAASQLRCAACHVGGGLVMKELDTPWINWNSAGVPAGRALVGVNDVVSRNRDLFGDISGAQKLESKVRAGHRAWVPARVGFLKSRGVKEVLRPLFCATDVNLDTTGGADLQVSSHLLIDSQLTPPSLITGGVLDGEAYDSVLKDIGQRIIDGRTGKPLVVDGETEPVRDTVFPFVTPRRSAQDEAYVTELFQEGIVDLDFVKDVLSIDFTRPLFSPTRCGMLEKGPDLAAEDITPAKLKEAFQEKLANASDPATVGFRASLGDPSDAPKHDAAAKHFVEACAARSTSEPGAYTRDIVRYTSHLRRAARRLRNPVNGGIIEFSETLPTDDQPEAMSAFDPITCKLP